MIPILLLVIDTFIQINVSGGPVLSSLTNNNSSHTRVKKLLNPFVIVSFPNLACQASDSDYNGTCIASSECSGLGGTISGSCASGFGACCILKYSGCGGTISNNLTYIVNSGFPGSSTTAADCKWTLKKSQSDVCFIRLDFDTFTIADPYTASGNVGACTTDYFQGKNAKTG